MLTGKGMFIWRIQACEGGDVKAIAAKAQAAGMSHVLIKIANSINLFGNQNISGHDLANDPVKDLVAELKARNIQAWGWHYITGFNPEAEARVGGQRALALNLDGYVIDAEKEFDSDNHDATARRFMTALRSVIPDMIVALSSYRYPYFHREFPWAAFLERCDLAMPQVRIAI